MQLLKPFLCLFICLSFLVGNAQIIKLDLDSVYVICKHKDFVKRIKKGDDKLGKEFKMEVPDSLKKMRKDTILIGNYDSLDEVQLIIDGLAVFAAAYFAYVKFGHH